MKPGSPFSPARGNASDAAVRQTLSRAIGAIGAGQLGEAARILDAAPAVLKTAVGQNVRGDIFLKAGDTESALRAFDAAIRLQPQMPEAHANRGVALQALGRLDDAIGALDRALKLRSGYATAHFNRGNVLKALGRMSDAAAAYGRALAAQPTFPEAALNRGLALVNSGQALEALGEFTRALAQRPKYLGAYIGRAMAYRELGDFAQAFGAIDAALQAEPDNRDALYARNDILAAAGRAADALADAEHLCARFPDDGRAHAARSTALRKVARMDDALGAAREAVRVAPSEPTAHTALGIVLTEAGQLADALTAFERARALGGSLAEFQHFRALALGDLGDSEEAVAAFDRVLADSPDDNAARTHRGYIRLSVGDYRGGWEDHEARLVTHPPDPSIAGIAPTWRGEDIAGKRVLVHAEQGLGDTIQFTRYIPLMAARGAILTLKIPRVMRDLYETSFPELDVTEVLGGRKDYDYQISFMSLPHAFGTDVTTVPDNVPYLRADPALVEKWRGRIGGDGVKVGIAWQGNPKYGRDRLRSMHVSAFLPLMAVPNIRLISLQTARPAEQLKSLPDRMRVETLGEEIVSNPEGFREMAAVMEALDVLVTSDTGPAHLAGALGRPIFVALGARPDWRWMRSGEDTPWYPTMRLIRQETDDDWGGVFTRIAERLMTMRGGSVS